MMRKIVRRFASGEIVPPELYKLYDEAMNTAGRTGTSQAIVTVGGKTRAIQFCHCTIKTVEQLDGAFHGCIIVIK